MDPAEDAPQSVRPDAGRGPRMANVVSRATTSVGRSAGRIGRSLGLLGLGLLILAGPADVAHDRWAATGLLMAFVGALISAFAGALVRRAEGFGLLLMAIAITGYAASAFAYAIHPAAAATFPSAADAGRFLFYPIAIAALIPLARSRFPGFSVLHGMDTAISALALAAVGALVLRGTLPQSLGADATGHFIYAIADLVLVGCFAASMAAPGRGSTSTSRFLVLGALGLTVGDAVHVSRISDGHFTAGTITTLAWGCGVLAFAAALSGRAEGAGARRPGDTPIAIPLLSALICLPIAIFRGRADAAAVTLASVGLLAVVARLSLALREHERLVGLLSSLNGELAHAAEHDALTGLANRSRLAQVDGDRGLASGRVLVLVDLDEFKAINDSFGHAAGDRVLQAVADRLRSAVRPQDLVVRLGGDEFAALLSEADEGASRMVAARFLATLDEPLEIEGQMIFVRASVGVAVATPGEALTSLMPRADASMYHAKSSGGVEQISVFRPGTHHQILDNLALATDLRGALARDELILHYQPIVELATRDTVGFEALVRWEHPERGLVPPLTFIPLAEQGGLMPEIGQWILEQTCRTAAGWRAHGADSPYVSVNLSVRQLQDPDFLARFDSALKLAQLPVDKLVVEVTETALASGHDTIHVPLDALRRLGVRVYIDDFGTGYSSLGYIRDLPLDGVKLDRAFARDLTTSPEAWTLAQAIIALLDNLKLAMTAEGIESAAQLAQLRSLGCMYAQGYYFAKPQPSTAIDDMMIAAATEAKA